MLLNLQGLWYSMLVFKNKYLQFAEIKVEVKDNRSIESDEKCNTYRNARNGKEYGGSYSRKAYRI